MKETTSIFADKEFLEDINKVCEKHDFVCGKCGAKMFDVNYLLSAFFIKEKSLERNSDEQGQITLELQYLVEMLCDRRPMSELTEKEIIEYETRKSYPVNYLRINNAIYEDDSGCYWLKRAEKAFVYTDDQCDCAKLFSV